MPRAHVRLVALVARAAALAVLASAAVVAPVVSLSASAAPAPVEADAQVVSVPAVAGPGAASAPAPRVLEGPKVRRDARAPDRRPPPPTQAGAGALTAATGAISTADFRMLAVSWRPQGAAEPGATAVAVRVRTEKGWGAWEELGVQDAGPDAGTAEARGASASAASEALWVPGGANGVDVRVAGPGAKAPGLSVALIEPGTSSADPGQRGAPAASASAAVVGMPAVISRQKWGADESLRTANCPGGPEYLGAAPKAVFVHHTAGTNDYSRGESAAIVRGVYYYHTQVQKWCDVGYNALVDRYGQVFEGRAGGLENNVVGAHSAGFNAQSWGVAVLGSFDAASPPRAATDALRAIVGWKVSREHIDPRASVELTSAGGEYVGTSRYRAGQVARLRAISGHRDVGVTSCPGARLYPLLDALAADVARDVAEVRWQARGSATSGQPEREAFYGAPGSQSLACDLDGDGIDGIAIYRSGAWYVRGDISSGPATRAFSYGFAGTTAVCGDFGGLGRDGIAVYQPSTGTWWLRNEAGPGAADRVFSYGFPGTTPVAGDWSGSGHEGIGVYENATGLWFLRGTADAGPAGARYQYGFPGAIPVAGDVDGDGAASTGVFAGGRWLLRRSITPGPAEIDFGYGVGGDAALLGAWTTPGREGVAVTRTWP